jgi:glycosyltransferase involved in cell wall biosynthesis
MRIHRITAPLSYGLLRFCVILRDTDIHHLRILWHGLRHGSWRSIQNEIFPTAVVSAKEQETQPKSLLGDSARKTVLVIDRSLPRFDRDAGSRATWQYIKLLREMGYNVTTWGHDYLRREPYASMLEDIGVEVVSGWDLACGRWRNWVRKRVAKLDYVIIHRPNVAVAYMNYLRQKTNTRILYFGVDLRWLRNQRRYEIEGDSFYRTEAHYWQGIENQLIGMAHTSYFYSYVETEIVSRQVPTAQVQMLPLFVYRGKAEGGLSYQNRSGLMFVGGFAHQPNVDGILWFVNEIFPLVRAQLGDISVRVVGANPPDALRRCPGLELTGAVSDQELQELYDKSRVIVAPLRYGAGIKGKVVEALFQHVPLVTTAIGAEGMPTPEKVMAVCDLPDGFASEIIRLYTDADLWKTQCNNIKIYVAKYFSATTARGILEKAFHT